MIKSTFCHLPGISLAEERSLWQKGLRDWDDLLCWAAVYYDEKRYHALQRAITQSQDAFELKSIGYFLAKLPTLETYRIYPDFSEQIFFLDIETDGLDEEAAITCLTVLNAGNIQSFLCTENLDAASKLFDKLQIAVTFHGTRFDIPRLLRRFPSFNMSFHVDLAKILHSHKIRGGLKDTVRRFGWQHDQSLAITNGKEAAEAWADYLRSGNRSILEDLCAYNQADVRMLEFLMRTLTLRLARSIPF